MQLRQGPPDGTGMPLCNIYTTNEAPVPALIQLLKLKSKPFCNLATDIAVCLRSTRSPSMTL